MIVQYLYCTDICEIGSRWEYIVQARGSELRVHVKYFPVRNRYLEERREIWEQRNLSGRSE